MLHGASLAAQIITMMDLESARKAKVEEVMEFNVGLIPWSLIISATEEWNGFLMFAHTAACALHW